MRKHYPLLSTIAPLLPFRAEIRAHLLAPQVKPLWKQVIRSQHWGSVRRGLLSPQAQQLQHAGLDCSADAITAALRPEAPVELLLEVASALKPWRIGPYKLGELQIDSEWRSSLKWGRIEPLIAKRPGMRVADIGCSNGYFLFKLAQQRPELGLGFDPVDRCWLQFALLQLIFRLPNFGFVPAGLSALEAFPEFFDLILCMGVMYHQRDPLAATQCLYRAARPGAQVIVESLVIDRPGTECLVPDGRYAKMRNAWVIPTADALKAFMEQSGFRDVTVHRFGPITPAEQRRTAWAPYESLADFLDPSDPSKTVEGHPAPHSAAVVGRK